MSQTKKPTDVGFIEKHQGRFAPFVPDICTMAGIKRTEIAQIPTLAEFIKAQFNDADCHTAFSSVDERSRRYSVDWKWCVSPNFSAR